MTESQEYRHFSGGEWREAEHGSTFDVHEPYTRAVL